MADPTSDELFKKLDTKHPDWLDWEDEWTRYRDVIGDTLVEKENYLPRNQFEPLSQYSFRVDMSQFIPESGLALERILGALFDEKPKREMKGSEADLKDFLDRSTRKGDNWNATMEQIAFNLLGYGTTRILLNVPPVETAEEGLRRVDEQALKVRPWLTIYTPLSVIDWEFDQDDRLSFARIKEERTRKQDDKLEPHVREIRFIEYDTFETRWWVFVEKKDSHGNQWTLDDQDRSEHGLGIVPMVFEEMRELKPGVGHSFVRYSSRADIRKFQCESDFAYDTYMHAHPWLAIWTEEELKEIGLGSQQYLKLNPGRGDGSGREDAQYITTASAAFDALQKSIDESRTQIFRQAQVDPMGIAAAGKSNDGIFQASGAARSWSFGTSEARILSRIADTLERLEVSVFEIVIRLQRGGQAPIDPDEKLFKGVVQYPESFDMASTAQLIEERSVLATQVNSPTLIKEIDKRIASSKVGDVPAEVLNKIHQEIERNPLMGVLPSTDPFGFPDGGGDDDSSSSSDSSVQNGSKTPTSR